MNGNACPEHGPPSEPEHRFCEVCGRNLVTGELASLSVPTIWLSSRAAGASCAACGAAYVDEDAYCDHCGRRRSIGRDHAELDLGTVAGVTDRGLRRRRNEDAVAVGRAGSVNAAVVCDGVSTSTRSDAAAYGAAEAGLGTLLAALARGVDPPKATVEGARAAAAAARAAAAGPDAGDTPPSCTYVSGIVTADAVTVGWIGDSRAYWLGPDPSCLTVDDSVAGQLAAGRSVPATLDADPGSRALIRWLGADSDDVEAQVVSLRPAAPGRVLLCSDGLHHYLSDPSALAAASSGRLIDVARHLTTVALDGGGHDNIAVAVLSYSPSGGSVP
ncbi:Serine/threonine protein phosphatase PrpC [Micromonospora rhizosphaerae]|uniref:Serine/threonine protein phosphatase PrpC n=1 Tax=Micromonospora rhizosphaerae TaxID=568872 RepID=A0A1C6SPS2_9ACTN|nr:protein phosphatase 2C domain-containing protein [Micromonospora rhizosphaerae]SCL31636.1 Serine/threonine protein phosphatase PrpC [Micromonospora rhizosphaerae]